MAISPGRYPDQRRKVVRHLRHRIVSGKWGPGDSLPTQAQMRDRLNVSSGTVEAAYRQLAEHGFIETRRSAGTFVAARPPHLWRYGLVMPTHHDAPEAVTWSRYYTSLERAARELAGRRPRSLRVYHGIDAGDDAEDATLLRADLNHELLAGVITPGWSPGSPPVSVRLLHQAGLPVFVVGHCEDADRLGFVSAAFEPNFADRAVHFLKQQGCRRVAAMTLEHMTAHVEQVQSAAAAAGLATRPTWVMGVRPGYKIWHEHIAALLMSEPKARRPDGLVILDDNLLKHATIGLRRAGVTDEQVKIVAHANFPYPTPSELPVTRLGHDIDELVARAIVCIDVQRRGEQPPKFGPLPLRFEHEPADRTGMSRLRSFDTLSSNEPARATS